MQRPKSKGPRRGVSSAPQVPAGLEKMSIVGSNRRANPSSRPNIGGADTHRSEGSLRSQASSSFQRQYGEPQQETLGGGSSGHHPVIAALQSCVKVFCTAVAPSYMLPWMRGEESHRVGSAFAAILPSGERRIFTHAQVVENCTLVQVRRAVLAPARASVGADHVHAEEEDERKAACEHATKPLHTEEAPFTLPLEMRSR